MSHETARGLLARASDDAAAVHAALDVAGITDGIVGFHAQQAVEKALKAVLASRDVEFPFTHDLEGLLELCARSQIEVPEALVSSAGLLTPYAVRHRYGEEPPKLVDRQTAERLAALAVAWAADSL